MQFFFFFFFPMENCTSEAALTKSHLCVVYAWDCFSHSPFTNPQMQSKNFQSWLVTSQFNNQKPHRSGTYSGKIHVVVPHIYFWSNFLSVVLSFTCSPAPVTVLCPSPWLQVNSLPDIYVLFAMCLSHYFQGTDVEQLLRCPIFCIASK